MYCLEREIDIKPKHFEDEKLLNKIWNISWKSYLNLYDNYDQDY